MPLTFSLSNKFLELNRVSLFLDPKRSILWWRIIEASGFCVLIKILSVSLLDTDSNLISKEIWVNNDNLCLMHELKFLIAFWKKNQRLLMEGITQVEEKKNKLRKHLFLKIWFTTFLPFWLLDIKGVGTSYGKYQGARKKMKKKWGHFLCSAKKNFLRLKAVYRQVAW